MPVSFDIGLLPNRPVNECLELARAAEDFGYDGVWLADSQCVMRDAYAILAMIAAQTGSIRIASGVTNAITRHPAVLANAWATLDEISDGRAVLGIGVGESSIRTLGLKPERLAALEEKIGLLRALMNGDEVEWEGNAFRLTWPRCRVPVVLACSGPKSLQLGGRIADGVLFQVGADPAFVRYALDNIRLGAEQAGRSLDDVELFMRVATSVSSDRAKARDEIKGYAAIAAGTVFKTVPREYFSDELWQELAAFKAGYDYFEHGSNEARHRDLLTDAILDAIAIAGTPKEAVPRFQEIVNMGVRNFVWPANMPDAMHFLQEFAEEVMPNITTEEESHVSRGQCKQVF